LFLIIFIYYPSVNGLFGNLVEKNVHLLNIFKARRKD
jgi:hypothetical protein